MAELAVGEGGSDVVDSNAQVQSATSDVNIISAFIKRGEIVLKNFAAGVPGFKDITRKLATIE